ncbi:uncharacterized protein LOC111688721 [Lucilia cuprina]|uniref:uncharacterized protein LOC111688721 n=1 Tax=Lucilia cuprina TaxID=7375 RepID=UPI001F06985C|nr:uncharacterized protein LOC111688721 [Lucilia cuprina]
MKMDSHSKNVYIIGILYIIGCLLFSFEPLTKAIGLTIFEDYEYETTSAVPIFWTRVAFYAILGILAGIMVVGVVKQRHLLVAPFLIATCINLIGLIIWVFLAEFVGIFNDFYNSLYTLGVHILIIYPIYTLFVKLRAKSLKEKSLAEPYCQQDKKSVEVLTQKLCV